MSANYQPEDCGRCGTTGIDPLPRL